MLITYFLAGLFKVIINFLNWILPSADQNIVNGITDLFNYLIIKINVLAFYYLPTSTLIFWINAIIAVFVLSLLIKLTLRIISLISGGLIKTDKI